MEQALLLVNYFWLQVIDHSDQYLRPILKSAVLEERFVLLNVTRACHH